MTPSIPHPSQDQSDRTLIAENNQRKSTIVQTAIRQMEAASLTLPTQTTVSQRPIHTAVAYMMAAGRKRSEIAIATGMDPATLSNLAKQPWFRTLLKEIADAAGKDMVKTFLEGEVLPALEVLHTIIHDEKQKGATRVAAISQMLDRHLGKPVAHIDSKTKLNIHTAADARDQVESELERIDRELRDRGVKTITSQNN